MMVLCRRSNRHLQKNSVCDSCSVCLHWRDSRCHAFEELKNSKMMTECSETAGFFLRPTDGLALSRLKRFGSRIRESKLAIGRATNQIRSRVIESRMKLAQHR